MKKTVKICPCFSTGYYGMEYAVKKIKAPNKSV